VHDSHQFDDSMPDRKIQITAGIVAMEATLNHSETANLIWGSLPLESDAKVWGDEVYFDTSIKADSEDPLGEVPSGTLAYWPPGSAFCVFFGQAPYSPVNVFGQLDGEPRDFAAVRDGDKVNVEKVGE
jgi:hypothetical protein